MTSTKCKPPLRSTLSFREDIARKKQGKKKKAFKREKKIREK